VGCGFLSSFPEWWRFHPLFLTGKVNTIGLCFKLAGDHAIFAMPLSDVKNKIFCGRISIKNVLSTMGYAA